MAKCYLTERQKNLVRSIVPGLQDGTVRTEWVCVTGDDAIMSIFGLDRDGTLWREVWEGVTESDFDDFCECGFFRRKDGNRYTLSAQMIIEAVNSNFDGAGPKEIENPLGIKLNSIFSEPSTSPQFQCDIFVIMPFAEEFKPVYESVIKSLEKDLDLNLKKGIKRGDDFFSHRNIMDEIWSALNACKIVIADCTGRNANVFYELGIAHTLGKPYILITQNIKDAPFDIQGRRLIEYQDSIAGTEKLKADLKKAVLALMSELSEAEI